MPAGQGYYMDPYGFGGVYSNPMGFNNPYAFGNPYAYGGMGTQPFSFYTPPMTQTFQPIVDRAEEQAAESEANAQRANTGNFWDTITGRGPTNIFGQRIVHEENVPQGHTTQTAQQVGPTRVMQNGQWVNVPTPQRPKVSARNVGRGMPRFGNPDLGFMQYRGQNPQTPRFTTPADQGLYYRGRRVG